MKIIDKIAKFFLKSALMFFIVLAGCMANNYSPYEPVNSCSHDDDCIEFEGQCDLELNVCIADPDRETATVVLLVDHPSFESQSEQHLTINTANHNENNIIRLPHPVSVRGKVVDEAAGYDSDPISANLTFRRLSELEGLRFDPIYVNTEDADEFDNNYHVSLLPGRYEVTIEPSRASSEVPSVHRYYLKKEIIEIPVETANVSIDFVFESETRLISGVARSFDGTPLDNVRVFAYNDNTGERLSNVALTQCEDIQDEQCGLFTLALHPDVLFFSLNMSGSEENPLLPTISLGAFSILRLDKDKDSHVSAEEFGEQNFPEIPEPRLFLSDLEGENRQGEEEQISGAILIFESLSDNPLPSEGSYELEAETNEFGEVVALNENLRGSPEGIGILLRPGCYSISIIPPSGSQFASSDSHEVCLEEISEKVSFEYEHRLVLGTRSRISGFVLSPDGSTTVANTSIEATGDQGEIFFAFTDEFGGYQMYVDRDSFNFTIIPEERLYLPWTKIVGIPTYNDDEVNLSVGVGTPLSGTILLDSNEEPVPSEYVEAFLVEEDDDGNIELRPFGRSSTSETGEFLLMVPGPPIPYDQTD